MSFCTLGRTRGPRVGECGPYSQDQFDERYFLHESEAENLVLAIENCRGDERRAARIVSIIKRQPWFEDLCVGLRAKRHLDPSGYIRLTNRADQFHAL